MQDATLLKLLPVPSDVLALPLGKREDWMSAGGMQGGSVSWFASGGDLCQLRPGVLCAVAQAALIAGHALLFIHCLGSADAHHKHKQTSRCVSLAAILMFR